MNDEEGRTPGVWASTGDGRRGIDRAWGRLTSLALRSDLLIVGAAAEIEVTEACVCVRTPSLPRLRVGNAVVFPHPPEVSDVVRWITCMERRLGPETARFGRIAWEGGPAPGDVHAAFAQAGFTRYDSLSMTTAALGRRPTAPPTAFHVRPVVSDTDWEGLLAFHVEANPVVCADDRAFLAARLGRYRADAEAGRGAWFAAYADGHVVGCCGVALGMGLGRLQGLETSTRLRRAGVGLALVDAAGAWALRQEGTNRLVSVVDPGYHARRLFASAGFAPHDLLSGVVPGHSLAPPAG
ncbi:GNAT family N-acetyltransferase [Streptomyces chumphonensis]|uniref:GNAT family N-acetyltransferase n=1 Tax=Streptomyces chumphonensis TaxID=1214925 RepID=UPI003D745D6C